MKLIPSRDLKPTDIPGPHAHWDTIGEFALTFDGYEAYGFEGCARLANGEQAPVTLNDYRAALFFEQRRWRHFGYEPDERAMEAIRALVEKIRGFVSGSPTS